MKKNLLLIVFSLVFALLDQLTKLYAIGAWKDCMPVEVIEGFFSFCYVENRGAAWGMFQGRQIPLLVFSLFALVWILWKIRPAYIRMRGGTICLALLIGGIIGNSYDRLFRTGVVDFLDFHWWDKYHFPAFNVADSCICVGVALMCILQYLADRRKEETTSSK